MKVCFIASVKHKDKHSSDYKEIVTILKTFEDKVFCDHVINYSQADLDNFGLDEKRLYNKKIIDQIKKSDIVVAETTSESLSVGYLISVSLDLMKPTILLYKGDGESNILSTVEETDKLLIGNYKETSEIKVVLRKLIIMAKSKSDVRFNFFVSPKILAYLDWVSQQKMIPRSVFLRNLIKREMKKDREFKG